MKYSNNKYKLVFTFEWHSLLRDLLRNSWLIVMAGVILFMCLYVGERSFYSPTYTSSATLVIRAKSESTGDYSSLSVSAGMTQTFASVFKDPAIEKLTAQNLGMDHFDGVIETSVSEGVNLMRLSVTADDPQMAYKLLCSMLEVYPSISEAVFSNTVISIPSGPRMPQVANVAIPTLYKGLGILGAMAAMAMIIALISLCKDTVKHENSFEKNVDAKLLGTITHEKAHLSLREKLSRKKRSLLMDDAFASLKFSEDYQKLATRLEQMQKSDNAKTFAVTSVEENEGKSTAAANIALSLAGRGYNVLLVDLDVRKPAIYKIFGYRDSFNVEFNDVLARKIAVKDYKFLRYKKSNLYIAMNKRYRADAPQWLGSDLVKECITSLGNKMDYVIIDTPPLAASADAASLIRICDKTLLIVRTDVVRVGEINDAVLTIASVGGDLAGCILNDVYRPFTLFGQMGSDESRKYSYRYDTSKRYTDYGRRPLSESTLDVEG